MTPVDVRLVGTAPAPLGPVLTASWEGAVVTVQDADRLLAYERAAVLAGVPEPARRMVLPAHARATLSPSDGLVVIAEGSAVRAVDPSGALRWELPHDPWHGGHREPRPPCAPAVSPDGRFVSVVLPCLARDGEPALLVYDSEPRRRYTNDRLVLVDATTGRIHGERPVTAVSSTVAQRWSPDGTELVISCWTAWYSWAMYRVTVRPEGCKVTGGPAYREVTDLGSKPGRVLSVRRAEGMTHDDEHDDVAVHDIAVQDGAADRQVALVELAALGGEPDDELGTARRVGDAYVVVSLRRFRGDATWTHHLCAWPALHPLGAVAYPVPVTEHVASLGDGTWLTTDGSLLYRWELTAP
ncbi:hypothetical protein ACFO1B_23850 [Dactylosporangium siamense]|nr:hypothetical protein [Dactylosporangium siamense]